MLPWITAHPWMTFFIALSALEAVRELFGHCPACVCPGTTTTQTSGLGALLPRNPMSNVAIPMHNGVYAGLVRR